MTARKIIVGYDGSADARTAAAWALDEAAHTGALVEFFHAMEWPTHVPAATRIPAPAVWPGGEIDRGVHGMLDEAVATARQTHPGVRTETSIEHANAVQTLVERSAEASLIVLGSRGHSAAGVVLGSVSVAVSAHAHCPVVVTRGTPEPGAPVLVGYDGSPAAQLALGFGFEQAQARDATLHVVQAVTPPNGLLQVPPAVTAAAVAADRDELEDLMAGWLEKYPDVAVFPEVVVDHPAHALTAAARAAQLVVVGSRGRGALRGMVLGSVGQHLLHRTAVPVAIVRERPGA
ncbi:universal stress protein [Pseudosporangium ferrugineum]|uniref:Nucleotide-binding universal stress UspA family protein n=1 Tax=Pseudosporangium ferrugineum TaxID=439699 RepID=A0A2T0SG23_9ACTN|nr:universal stress protein [Pseudosporangium ferrugineum]PRY32361.1 nucleotide-binding universal stress UspA family protein [Pseudosporangium ferrugineum]